jgi:hypothetical protein
MFAFTPRNSIVSSGILPLLLGTGVKLSARKGKSEADDERQKTKFKDGKLLGTSSIKLIY